MMRATTKSVIYALICVFLWSLIPIVAKLGQVGLDNHQFLFWSSGVSWMTFLVICWQQKKIKLILSLSAKDWSVAIFLGMLGSYLYYILLYYGYANAKGIEVLIIQYCWPILVIVLSVLILRERLNKRKVMAVILGFLGVFLVLSKGRLRDIYLSNLEVDGVVLLAAFVFGLFSVLSKKVKIDSLSLVSVYFLTATIISFGSMIFFSEFCLPTRGTILPILINGIFVNGVSYIFWIGALKAGKASFVALFIFLTPVFSTLLLILFFKEPFYLVYAFGMALVILGGLLNKE